MTIDIQLSPADVLALAGQNQLAAVGGGDLTATGARSTSDLMAPERVHECCRILGCKPIALVERVRELAARKDPDPWAIAQAIYNSDDAVTVAGIASVIAAEIG